MSSSSNNNSGGFARQTLDLRYVASYCYCGRKAVLRLVESEKPTKGMLYHACEQKPSCGFWEWCNPVSATWQPSGFAVTARGAPVNQPSLVMAGPDEDQKWLKLVLFGCLIVCGLCLFVTLVSLVMK
ncbi:hypothetical protein RHGRI_031345 [Rhododendron griersonianum]|uniref:GRF-type domain-containing protein n=1 Tax=Rhododendron griersonianum TaxID=479676 RepID=A0AAV6IAQ0_9ERIC|nr:hypothetical protein RHGRI_031345 [Rhododendron griersonianum]